MTRKVYRTAQGKIVDLGALQLRNENVRAVGNMKVNARGDLVDSANRAINTRNQQVARQYSRQTTNVTDGPVHTSQASAKVPAPSEDFDDQFVKPQSESSSTAVESLTKPAAGLAAAIARAREIRQDPLKTHQSVVEHQSNTGKS